MRAVDWKENEYMAPSEFCDEFKNLDRGGPTSARRRARTGRGLRSNPAVTRRDGVHPVEPLILFNSTMISFNMAEAARVAGVSGLCAAARPCCATRRARRAQVRAQFAQFGAFSDAPHSLPSQVRVVGVHLP